ncbi:MAG: hydrogenase expression protein HypE [Rhodoblastus sp.]
MSTLAEAVARGKRLDCLKPWPRILVDQATWMRAAREISKGEGDLVALWSDGRDLFMALRAKALPGPVVLTLPATDGAFHAIGRMHPPAQRLERAIADLYGLVPEGAADDRPWIDHGVWGVRHPAGAASAREPAPVSYKFLAAEGAPLHQIPVGPVHAGIIEPGHFRFSANGETVVRLEERLGYTHKGTETLMRGASCAQAARFAGRVSGDSTVAYAWAFSDAVESALGVEAPARAKALRGVMAELERIANHLGDVGAICNDAAFAVMQAHCAVLREQVLRASGTAFGHRLMMDAISPGGVVADLPPEGARAILDALAEVERTFPAMMRVYDSTASLQDRTVSTGRVSHALVAQFAAGGFVGRAAGRDFDARKALPYAPYDTLEFEVPVLTAGDVDARLRVRALEIAQSTAILRKLLETLPAGPLSVDLPQPEKSCEGLSLIEGFRGDIFVWVRLDAQGAAARAHLRDPSWFQWPLLEVAIEGNIVADFPLCNKSFNCSYSGHDV